MTPDRPDTDAIRARADAARHGWKVTHPWTTADYAVQALLRTDVPALCDEVDAAHDLIAYLVEDTPCVLDHHGYCQEHHGGFREVDGRPECWNAAARALLSHPDTEGDE